MNVKEFLKGMAGMYQNKPTEEAIKIIMMQLSEFKDADILIALRKCLYELKYFPSFSDIIQRIPNCHPSPNEAWALCPKDESQSTCWTAQIKQAYFKAYDLLDENENIQMRMAFLEVYPKLLAEAIQNKIPAKWELSMGTDKADRERCIIEAVNCKRLPTTSLRLIETQTEPSVLRAIEDKLGKPLLKNITMLDK